MLKPVKKNIQYGHHQLTLEVGEIARQATAAVMVSMQDTVVLVSCVVKKEFNPDIDFLPLTVNYQEKTSAAGRIPGSYFRREGRPSEHETLVSRLIDRPIRPMFPDGFHHEVQVIATVLSLDPQVPSDIPAMIGASAALYLTGVPLKSPIAPARVGYDSNQFLLNPSYEELVKSKLDLVMAGTENGVIMVESQAEMLSEALMLDAIVFAHQYIQPVIKAIKELKEQCGVVDWQWQPPVVNPKIEQMLTEHYCDSLLEAYQIPEKIVRYQRLQSIRDEAVAKLSPLLDQSPSNNGDMQSKIANQLPSLSTSILSGLAKLEKKLVRQRLLTGNLRIDKRDTRTVRGITIRVPLLPRPHGSCSFTRGETQAIVTVTLGSERDAQVLDLLDGEYKDRFIFHYNFPPFCVGETGMLGSPKRREIGHGRLGKKGVIAVLPDEKTFPYVIRVLSDITESNGSSSMATVCGASLALMDAGVPLKAPVAGIAMGLIKEGDQFVLLSDISGDEDHLGDMDFKVVGTHAGITALQMDIKIEGINRQIMENALNQARDGRLHILSEMEKAIDKPRAEVSKFAPRIITFMIKPEKIRDVIGKGGAIIRSICDEANVTIDIEDDGKVSIFAIDAHAGEKAKNRIKQLTVDVVVGQVFEGVIEKLMDFGAFVTLFPGRTGFLHISQISNKRIENIHDILKKGQEVKVQVVDLDRQGRIRISMKALLEEN